MTAFQADDVNLSFTKKDWSYPQNPAIYGKVAVLMGGYSAERSISLQSGETILKSLQEAGVNAHALLVDEDLKWLDALRHNQFDRAVVKSRRFKALEGHHGVVF